MVSRSIRLVTLVALGAMGVVFFCCSAPTYLEAMAQQQGNELSRWQSHDYPGNSYVGSRVCAECHSSEASNQLSSAMGQAMEAVADCKILIAHPKLTYRNGRFVYEIDRRGGESLYTVTDGVNSVSERILFCFGRGVAGQTYVFRHNGVLYESRVSYYSAIQNLDITILHSRSIPRSIEDAIGRPLSPEAAQGCFDCHSTASSDQSGLRLDSLTPGVTCERCHGPGAKHMAAMKSNNFKDTFVFNPGSLDSLDQTQEFCGFCHQGFDKVMQLQDQGGVNNVRFQPYRMFKSKGHLVDDPRISCVACHDPHDHLKRDPGFYDSKCFACHLSDKEEKKTDQRSAPPCPVAKKLCVTCHMPKVALPEMHFKFTDHWIRIVKPGEPVPR